MTTSPALVAGAAAAQQLPGLLFALRAGAYVDRLDRRRLPVAVNLARGAILAALAAAVWADLAFDPGAVHRLLPDWGCKASASAPW